MQTIKDKKKNFEGIQRKNNHLVYRETGIKITTYFSETMQERKECKKKRIFTGF
jgi:hypothetical protein